MKGEMSEGEPPEGMPATELIVLHDAEAEKSVAIVFFETEDDYQRGDEILNAMPAAETPGRRTSVVKYDVAVRMTVYDCPASPRVSCGRLRAATSTEQRHSQSPSIRPFLPTEPSGTPRRMLAQRAARYPIRAATNAFGPGGGRGGPVAPPGSSSSATTTAI